MSVKLRARILLGTLLLVVGIFVTPLPASAADETPAQKCGEAGGSWDGDKNECNFTGGDGKPDLTKITGSNAAQIRACLGSDGVWQGDKCGTKAGNSGSVTDIIRSVINVLLFVTGTAAVIVIVIAGLRFVTANGDSSSISKARGSITYAIIGLVVAVSAYAIVNFILDQLS